MCSHLLLLPGLAIGTLFLAGASPDSGTATREAGPSSRPAATGRWNIRDHVADPDTIIVQSHRGAGVLAPENTLEAFELGWKLGCWPEADVRTTSDGVIVAFHDSNFARVVKGCPPELKTKGVQDITFEQLSRLDVGAWKGREFTGRRVRRISEVFALMQGHRDRFLYLDIKNVDLPRLAEEVSQYDVGHQVILASTKYPLIREWKTLVPEGQTLLWMGGKEETLAKRLTELRENRFADITQLQIHVAFDQGLSTISRQSVDPFQPSDAFLLRAGEEARSHKIVFQALPWDAATPQVYWKLLDLGVMSFATDHPVVTREALRQYYAAKR